jgi:hypothetical protein
MVVRDCWNPFALPRYAGRWSGGIRVRREVGIPAIYKGEPLGFRADILADETDILEIKAVPTLLPLHDM